MANPDYLDPLSQKTNCKGWLFITMNSEWGVTPSNRAIKILGGYSLTMISEWGVPPSKKLVP